MENSTFKLQVLVATMNQSDHSLIRKMNLQSDAIIANQCDQCFDEFYEENGTKIFYVNRPDRGVGKNRNEALLHSEGDILTFADDDMIFSDGYSKNIERAFQELPDADAIIFNIKTKGENMGRRVNTKIKRIHFYNALNYGAARLSVRATSIKKENIFFHTCFGGGTIYSSGEDTLFIMDMLKHRLKIYAYPMCIAEVDQTVSTWFTGYSEKYYYDKGALYRAISKKGALLLGLQALIRHREYKKSGLTFREALGQMRMGIKAYDTLRPYKETPDQSNNI